MLGLMKCSLNFFETFWNLSNLSFFLEFCFLPVAGLCGKKKKVDWIMPFSHVRQQLIIQPSAAPSHFGDLPQTGPVGPSERPRQDCYLSSYVESAASPLRTAPGTDGSDGRPMGVQLIWGGDAGPEDHVLPDGPRNCSVVHSGVPQHQ